MSIHINRWLDKPIQRLAEDSIHVQFACNLRAVVASYLDILDALRQRGIEGDALREHPITRVWADKIASLAGIQGMSTPDMMEVHAHVDKLAEKKEVV